jgi:hypothetical protein
MDQSLDFKNKKRPPAYYFSSGDPTIKEKPFKKDMLFKPT